MALFNSVGEIACATAQFLATRLRILSRGTADLARQVRAEDPRRLNAADEDRIPDISRARRERSIGDGNRRARRVGQANCPDCCRARGRFAETGCPVVRPIVSAAKPEPARPAESSLTVRDNDAIPGTEQFSGLSTMRNLYVHLLGSGTYFLTGR